MQAAPRGVQAASKGHAPEPARLQVSVKLGVSLKICQPAAAAVVTSASAAAAPAAVAASVCISARSRRPRRSRCARRRHSRRPSRRRAQRSAAAMRRGGCRPRAASLKRRLWQVTAAEGEVHRPKGVIVQLAWAQHKTQVGQLRRAFKHEARVRLLPAVEAAGHIADLLWAWQRLQGEVAAVGV